MEREELIKTRIENLVNQCHLTRREADRFLELDKQFGDYADVLKFYGS